MEVYDNSSYVPSGDDAIAGSITVTVCIIGIIVGSQTFCAAYLSVFSKTLRRFILQQAIAITAFLFTYASFSYIAVIFGFRKILGYVNYVGFGLMCLKFTILVLRMCSSVNRLLSVTAPIFFLVRLEEENAMRRMNVWVVVAAWLIPIAVAVIYGFWGGCSFEYIEHGWMLTVLRDPNQCENALHYLIYFTQIVVTISVLFINLATIFFICKFLISKRRSSDSKMRARRAEIEMTWHSIGQGVVLCVETLIYVFFGQIQTTDETQFPSAWHIFWQASFPQVMVYVIDCVVVLSLNAKLRDVILFAFGKCLPCCRRANPNAIAPSATPDHVSLEMT